MFFLPLLQYSLFDILKSVSPADLPAARHGKHWSTFSTPPETARVLEPASRANRMSREGEVSHSIPGFCMVSCMEPKNRAVSDAFKEALRSLLAGRESGAKFTLSLTHACFQTSKTILSGSAMLLSNT